MPGKSRLNNMVGVITAAMSVRDGQIEKPFQQPVERQPEEAADPN